MMSRIFCAVATLAIVVDQCSAALLLKESMLKREDFVIKSKPVSSVEHEVVFAIKQKNLDVLESMVLERATPGNALYQKWMTFSEVGELIKNEEAASAVLSWLSANGIKPSSISKRKEYIKATASVSVWEKLFDTTFYYWVDESSFSGSPDAKPVLRAQHFSIPEELNVHLDTVFNTVQPLPAINKKFLRQEGSPFRSDFKVQEAQPINDDNSNLLVTVQYLNDYYSIPSNIGDASLGQSVFEEGGMSYSQADLSQFQTTYNLTPQTAIDIGGHEIPSSNCTFNTCGEGSLDIQYIMGVSQVTASTYYYVSGHDPFVAWVTDLANDANPPQANSMSWGSIEQQIPASVLNSFNNEALKLGAIGVTVTISSGDNGVANGGCGCTTNSGSSQSSWTGAGTWTGQGYFPSFPASSPWVTGVGATMGNNGYPPAVGTAEIACQSQQGGVITSGGGFSTYYAQPSWQTAAVSGYFQGLNVANSPASGYNANGRGIPDIAMMGVYYQVVVAGTVNSVFGTSCSSPLTAALVSLVNAARLKAGLSTVGYMNPTLYANANSFSDVTSGKNNCCSSSSPSSATCCKAGFNAIAGWDPLTGLGSITYPALASMFGV